MPTLSSGDLNTLKLNRQKSKVYLSIFRPQSVAAGTIAAIYNEKREIEINFTDGDSADIEEGMTVLIGTGFSTLRVGKVRARSFDSDNSILTIAENDLVMNVGDEINILKYWELWPVYHRVEVSNDDLTVYQDYDIVYTDQNEKPDPIVVMGSHTAKEIKEGFSDTSVFWSASGTWSPVDASLDDGDFLWEFEGGSPATYTGITPGFVTYDAPGWFWTKCTVTDGNGKTFTGRRAVIIHNVFGRPYTAFELRSLSGGWDEFGWTAEVVLKEDVPYTYHWDNALCILWHESYYDSTKREFGSQIDRGHILFTGWVEGDSLLRDPYTNNTTFRVSGAGPYLKQTLNFPVTLEHTNGTPDKWWLINDLTIDNAVRFFLRNSTTALTICDFYKSGQTLKTKYFDYGEDTVSNAVNNATYDRGSWVRLASDHYSALYLNEEPQIHSGTIGYVLAMEDRWWRDQITFGHAQRTNIAWTELSGVYFDGDEPAPMISMAPGESPLWDGNQQAVGGLICPDQDTLNIWAGRYLGWKNNPFPEANFPMAGNFAGVFDIIPSETVLVTLNGNDNRPGYILDNQGFLVRGVEHTYDGYNLLTNLRCEMLTLGDPGIKGRYPEEPPPEPEECNPCDPCDPAYPCDDDDDPPPSGTTAGGWRPCWVACEYALYYVDNIKAPPSTQQPDVYDATGGEPFYGAFAVDPYNPEDFQFMHGARHYTNYHAIKYRSGMMEPGLQPWQRTWQTLVTPNDITDAMKAHLGWTGPKGMRMVGLEFDINCEHVFYVNIDADVRIGGTRYFEFLVMRIEYAIGGGGQLYLPSKAPDWGSVGFFAYFEHQSATQGQCDDIRIGAFNLTKSSSGWGAQRNKIYVGGGLLGSGNPALFRMQKGDFDYSSDACTLLSSPTDTVTLSGFGGDGNNMKSRHIFVDPNNPDRLFSWLPIDLAGYPSFQMHDYHSGETFSFYMEDDEPCPPRMGGVTPGAGTIIQPCHTFAGDHHGISVTWHPEPDKNGQYVRFFDHDTNNFYYSDDYGETYYMLTPVGDIAPNGSTNSLQKWIISLVQDEHSKLYIAKNAKGITTVDGEQVDNQFCIGIHDPDPTHSDTEITFYDRSGVDDSGKGTVRMPNDSYCFAIVPVWTIQGEE